jgi:hypothetical protein
MRKYHLAQINIAYAKEDNDSAVMAGFIKRLDEINALADKAPGFVWRLQGEEGNAVSLQVFEDPLLLVNMSVWEDMESLKHYVYRSSHVELIRDRDAWFNKMRKMHQALWWVPAGQIPSVAEGKEKLALIQQQGVSAAAFTFARPFAYPLSLEN